MRLGISCDLDLDSVWCLDGGGEVPSLLAEVGLPQILGHYPESQTAEEAKQPSRAGRPSLLESRRAREGAEAGRWLPGAGLCCWYLGTWAGRGNLATLLGSCVLSCAQLLVEPALPMHQLSSRPGLLVGGSREGVDVCVSQLSG